MIQKYLIVIDEQSQTDTIESIKSILNSDGINLITQEFNPLHFQSRDIDGNPNFDEQKFKESVINLEYFKATDCIACDYNLIPNCDGFRIIQILRDLGYTHKKKIILYSAQIEEVIGEILQNSTDFEAQKKDLIDLIESNIEFVKRNGYDQEVIKMIKKVPDFDFEIELQKWFYSRENDTFNYLFPKYEGKLFKEIAIEIEKNTTQSVEFKRELTEQIISYLSSINGLNDD
jgi:hypothetical protein